MRVPKSESPGEKRSNTPVHGRWRPRDAAQADYLPSGQAFTPLGNTVLTLSSSHRWRDGDAEKLKRHGAARLVTVVRHGRNGQPIMAPLAWRSQISDLSRFSHCATIE